MDFLNAVVSHLPFRGVGAISYKLESTGMGPVLLGYLTDQKLIDEGI
jgi:hypothetical protein